MVTTNILTQKQKETLDYIERYVRQNGHSPLVTELQKHFGLSSIRSVTQRLDALEYKGLISRDKFRHRGIRIINKDASYLNHFINIPVIASAGCDAAEVYATENFDEYLTVDKKMLAGHSDVVAVKAVGGSMVDAGIRNGDYVLVEKTDQAASGDLVVALLGDMAVIKRFQRTGNSIILHPEARGYNPIFVTSENFRIFGKPFRTIDAGPSDDIHYVPLGHY